MFNTTGKSANADTEPSNGNAVTEYEWDGTESFQVALVSAIESAIGQDAANLSPLYEAVDIESVEAVVSNGTSENVSVIFSYENCFVEVRGDREITVTPFHHQGR